MIRWLITLILVALTVFLLWTAFGEWRTYAALQGQVEAEQGRYRDLLTRRREMQDRKKAIEQWNVLWSRSQAAGIAPEHWVVNEIDTVQEISWPELDRLLEFLSRCHPKTTGLWFNPKVVSIARAQTRGLGEGAADEEAPEEAAGDISGEPPAPRFSVRVSGEFLIPRLSKQ